MATTNGVTGPAADMPAPSLSGGLKRTVGTESTLGMQDFLQLMVEQLSNQDVMNPQSDTDYIAQMAQFSALQGVQTLQEYVLSSYAVSYTGKHVIIADDSSGQMESIYGQVERITFMNGQPMVLVNGQEYPLHKVMEVAESAITPVTDEQQALVMQYAAIEFEDSKTGEMKTAFGIIDRVASFADGVRVRMNGVYYPIEDIIRTSNEPIDAENL